ncbi:MAG: hypothetical protein IKJ26_00295 [Clostridia bacterium]|nr:hypothetical protein [Clostridia bacterium]
MTRVFRMLKKNWHWIFLALMILLTVYMDVYMAQNVLDSDTSEDVYHGLTIARENNPFSKDVYLSTELRLLDIATVFALFFKLTSNWTIVRICGTVVMQAYYVLSFWYLCRQAGVSRKSTVVGAGLLLLPFSTPYARLALYHLYYILYFANAFWIFALTLKVLRSKRLPIVSGCILCLLWAFVGINGIRHMMIIGLPLLAFTAIELLQTLGRYRWEGGRLKGETPFLQTDAVRLTAVMVVSCICFLAGFVFGSEILQPYYGVTNISSVYFRPVYGPDRYTDIFNGLLIAIGVRNSDLPLIGLRGLSLAAALVSFGYATILSLRGLKEETDTARRMLRSIYGLALITTTFVFIFEQGGRFYEQYYVPVLFLAFPVIAQEWDCLKNAAVSAVRKLLIVLTCLCLLFQGAYTTWFLRVDQWDMDDWNGLPLTEMNVADSVQDYVTFMKDNGYTHGMIDYWYANVMMEVADGEITVAPLLVYDNAQGEPVITVYKWGTSRTAFARKNLPEKIVAFIDAAAAQDFEQDYPHAVRVYQDSSMSGYEITPDDIV